MMKLILLFILTVSVVAAPKKDEAKEEVDLAVSAIYEKRNEDQIVEGNELLKSCKSEFKDDINGAEDCINKAIKNFKEEDLEKIADKIKLGSYDTKASKSAKTIREYLSERMSNALRGAPKNGVKEISIRDMKFVDHAVYAKIYRSQIGKNILLETTNYCLSNFGYKGEPGYLVTPVGVPIAGPDGDFGSTQAIAIKEAGKVQDTASITGAVEVSKLNSKKYETIDWSTVKPTQVSTDSSFWKEKATEFELCDEMKEDSGECKYEDKKVRSSSIVSAFKDFEFDIGPDYMKSKISFCTQHVVRNMCEVYRCRNVYTTTSKKEALDYCTELGMNVTYTSQITPLPTDGDEAAGIKACGLVDRLKEYRKVIGALGEIDKLNDSSKVGDKGFAITSTFSKTYNGGKGEKSIEDITTIASAEFKDVKFVDEAELQKLKDECFVGGEFDSSNKDCEVLVKNELDEEKSLSIRAEMEAETSAYLERVNQLKEKNDKEGLLEFLKEQGLDAKYGDLEPEELAKLIEDQYKSQRASLKKSMMDKYNKTRDAGKGAPTDEAKATAKAEALADVAKSNVVNMEKEKEKLETLLQYNNILTSYLGATIGSGDDKVETTLSYQRQIELDQGNDEFVDKYETYFDDQGASQSTENTNLQVDLNFIDSLLGNSKESDAVLEKKGPN